MAREFLLFLSNYGFCDRVVQGKGKLNEHYHLASISKEEVIELHKLKIVEKELDKVANQIRITQIPASVERQRVTREILERPNQNIFRRNILRAFKSSCIITGVTIESVLEASHIKPVEYKGDDSHNNGLCLRSDMHQLFDSNHLRILPSGELILTEAAATKNNYWQLKRRVEIPHFVDRA